MQAQRAGPGYAELEHAAHAAYLAALRGERIEVGDGFAVRTGAESNSENGVVSDAGDVEEVVAWMGGARRRSGSSAAGSDLHDRLVAAGCRPERTAVVMGARSPTSSSARRRASRRSRDEYRGRAQAVGFGEGAVGAPRGTWRAATAGRSAW